MRDTSLMAYIEIRDQLPDRQRAVLIQLEYFYGTNAEWPTARELTDFSGIDGAWKRLPELRGRGAVVEGPPRKCTISEKMAVTWRTADKRDGLF